MISFSIPSNELSALLQSISKIIPSQDPNRLRTEFLFEIRDQTLRITGSSPEIRISGEVSLLEPCENCRFTVPPADIVDYVKDLPEQPLLFKYEPNTELKCGPLEVRFDTGVIRFTATEGNTYPEFEKDKEEEIYECVIPSEDLQAGITYVLPAVAPPDMHTPNITGVCMSFHPDKLDLVATNSFNLALFSIKEAFIPSLKGVEKKRIILPSACAKEIKNYTARYNGEEVQVKFSSKSILFRIGSIEIESLLINANYPNYESIIPTNSLYKLIVNRQEFCSVTRRIIKFMDDKGQIALQPTDEGLKVTFEKKEENKLAEEIISLENDNNFEETLRFQKNTLSIATENILSKGMEIHIIDKTRPIVVMPQEYDDRYSLLNLATAIQ